MPIQIANNSLKQLFVSSTILSVQKCQSKTLIFDSILKRPIFFSDSEKLFFLCAFRIDYRIFDYSMRLLLTCLCR